MLASRSASASALVSTRAPLLRLPAHRRVQPSKGVAVRASQEYEQLQDITVYRAGSGDAVKLTELWQAEPGTKAVIPFLTHFADLTTWEYARKLIRVLPTLEASSVPVFVVGLGSPGNAEEFCNDTRFPSDRIFADPTGAAYRALGFNPGFAPDVDVNPYVKLLPMLAGIGSPGTIQEVLRGYLGDQNAKPVFDGPTPFDILGTGFQRPFELATLRLFNMVSVLRRWGDLSPQDTSLLTQQGGTLAFDGSETIFKHVDSGILRYADIDEVLRRVLAAEEMQGPTLDVAPVRPVE